MSSANLIIWFSRLGWNRFLQFFQTTFSTITFNLSPLFRNKDLLANDLWKKISSLPRVIAVKARVLREPCFGQSKPSQDLVFFFEKSCFFSMCATGCALMSRNNKTFQLQQIMLFFGTEKLPSLLNCWNTVLLQIGCAMSFPWTRIRFSLKIIADKILFGKHKTTMTKKCCKCWEMTLELMRMGISQA